MFRQISYLTLICFANLSAFAQTEKYSAPVKWERYKVSKKAVSVLFPKLPVSNRIGKYCDEEETNQYAAYANGVAYGLNITFRSSEGLSWCRELKIFRAKNFENRVTELKTLLKTEVETKINLNNKDLIKISGESFTYWLLNDSKNDRWFEFWVTEEDEKNSDIKNFLESFKLGKNLEGFEIKEGSAVNLGDETESNENSVTTRKETNLRIILKPRSSYTDAARHKGIQGTVTLRATFSSNGGIEKTVVLSELPFGLTEQAVIAARACHEL